MVAGTRSLRVGREQILQAFHNSVPPSHPFSGMVPGTRMEPSALMIRSASFMNPLSKGGRITSTSSELHPWPATSLQRCNGS